jgi:hypothetical protein
MAVRSAALRLIVLAITVGTGLVGVGAARAATRRAPIPPPAREALPWAALHMGHRGVPAAGTPFLLLYVATGCPHCFAESKAIDSLTALSDVETFIVSQESPLRAARYATSIGLRHPVVFDSGGVLRRALRVRLVPALYAYGRDGPARALFGARTPAELAALIASLQ